MSVAPVKTMIDTRTLMRNIGISAHIDSGKTTLTERILYYAGRIHAMHEVKGKDGVGATMDSMDLEREKGITIQSAATYVTWGGHPINIIDTPGHVDFTIEVERALRVLDGAILVLCGVAGVQSQSITVDRQMRRYGVPAIAFVNKCDRPGADPARVTQQLRDVLGHNAVMVQLPIGLEHKHEGLVDVIARKACYFEGDGGEKLRWAPVPDDMKDEVEEQRHKLIEALADLDDEIANAYLEGKELAPEELYPVIRKATIARKLTPVCLGSAFKNKGVQPLLDDVLRYLPSPLDRSYDALDLDKDEAPVPLACDPAQPLAMLAFKLEDGSYGQLTYCRVYQGVVKKGDFITNTSNNKRTKVGRLVQMHSDQMHDIEEARAGDICALFGIDCASGDTFTHGEHRWAMRSMFVPEAVVTLAVEPIKKETLNNFSKALNRFSKEDPTFRVSRDEESGQTIIGGMGELHLQIYIERILREYRVALQVGAPQVAYRETISQRATFDYVHKKQTGGSGQYAKVMGYIEPITRDPDAPDDQPLPEFEFVDETVGGSIPQEFIKSCEKGFREAIKSGSQIDMPVVGVRVVVNDGNTHPVDSSDRAFQTAALFAFRQAYPKAIPTIMEPIMKVVVEGPEEFSGNVLGGLNKRRGQIVGNTNTGGESQATAFVPLKEMFGYSNDLRSSTQGKAQFSMEFARYAVVPKSVQEELMAEAEKKRKDKRK